MVCYTNAPTAHLYLNDMPIGDEPHRDDATDILYWDIAYMPGTLRCEASNGASASLTTCGRPFALRAITDKNVLSHPEEVAHITVEAVDENGVRVPLADNGVTCSIQGPARLLGLENGDIRDTSEKKDNHCRLYNGCLIAYVALKSDQDVVYNQSQTARLIFTSPLLESAGIDIQVPAIP